MLYKIVGIHRISITASLHQLNEQVFRTKWFPRAQGRSAHVRFPPLATSRAGGRQSRKAALSHRSIAVALSRPTDCAAKWCPSTKTSCATSEYLYLCPDTDAWELLCLSMNLWFSLCCNSLVEQTATYHTFACYRCIILLYLPSYISSLLDWITYSTCFFL